MIETRVMPVRRVMAGLAAVATATVVRIIVRMTSVAVRRRIQIGFIFVTIETSNVGVLAHEWISGGVMIEACILPLRGLVTIAAFRTHSFLMGIVIEMAIDAGARGVSELHVVGMTIVTTCFEMPPNQLEISEHVVKRFLVQNYYLCVTALVICMANEALRFPGIGEQAVKTSLANDVHCNKFVAIHAKLSLTALVKYFVARRTLGLEIGMAADNFAGHDQQFDVLCRYIFRCHQSENHDKPEYNLFPGTHLRLPALLEHVNRKNMDYCRNR